MEEDITLHVITYEDITMISCYVEFVHEFQSCVAVFVTKFKFSRNGDIMCYACSARPNFWFMPMFSSLVNDGRLGTIFNALY